MTPVPGPGPRTQQRHGFDVADRMVLAEIDLDRFDAKFLSLEKRVETVVKVGVGVLVSVTTGSVLIALNLIITFNSNGGG